MFCGEAADCRNMSSQSYQGKKRDVKLTLSDEAGHLISLFDEDEKRQKGYTKQLVAEIEVKRCKNMFPQESFTTKLFLDAHEN